MTRFVRRHWGWYFVLLDFAHFKVKLLRFPRSGALSLQTHDLRNELWLFLTGEGQFKRATHYRPVSAGDYMLVSKNMEHAYCAREASWIIEVQFGEKCVESDIVRL